MAMQRLVRCALQLFLPVVALCQATSTAGRVVVVTKFGYQLTVPLGWNVDVPSSGVPVIYNYPREKALPQGLVPENGAMIYCAPDLAVLIPGISEQTTGRIARNVERDRIVLSEAAIPNFRQGSQFPRDIIRTDSDKKFDPSDELTSREISYSFTLRGTRFRLFLTYWKGDHQAAIFESKLKQILESIVGV